MTDRPATERRTITERSPTDPAVKLPNILISYVFLDAFETVRAMIASGEVPPYHNNWMLDSGAFTAFNSGRTIQHQQYLDTVKRIRGEVGLAEVMGLDVIGDWKASLANYDEARRQGVEIVPTFHVGEPWHVLKTLAAEYPKIALGGMVGNPEKLRWVDECFQRVWPCQMHALGIGSAKVLLKYPFHSCDCSDWWTAPQKFGTWSGYRTSHTRPTSPTLSVRRVFHSLHWLNVQVDGVMRLEHQVRGQWHAIWDKLGWTQPFRYYLMVGGSYGASGVERVRVEASVLGRWPDANAGLRPRRNKGVRKQVDPGNRGDGVAGR